jgi:hypothetical protein
MSNKANLMELLRGVQKMAKDASSSGGTIFSNLGLNAYNLEAEAKSLIPYNAPFYKSTPRVTSDPGGTAVNWKAVLASSPGIVTLPEALRAASMSLLEKDYSASFKTTAVEVSVSQFAQQAGRTFQDNLGFAQFSALQTFLRAQDQQLLCDGNSGPSSAGGNGFALGVTSTPVVSLVSGGSIPQSTPITAFAVALTNFGLRAQNDPVMNSEIVAGVVKGLTPKVELVNATGTDIYASGGTAIVSLASNTVTTSSGSKSVSIAIPAMLGAPGFAIYVDSTDDSSPAESNAYFQGIFNTNTIVLTSLVSGTQELSTVTGLATDYSYDTNAVDSYIAWALNWNEPPSGYSAFASYYEDLGGETLTGDGAGQIEQFTEIAAYLYDNYKSAPDRILIASQNVSGGSLRAEIQKAILNGASPSASRLNFDVEQGKVTSGTMDWSYEWPYSYDGTPTNIVIEVMPWLQPGQIIFQTTRNPYPQFSGQIPAAFEVHCLLDTFSVLWPVTQYEQSLGIANFTATKAYLPHVAAVLQNVG